MKDSETYISSIRLLAGVMKGVSIDSPEARAALRELVDLLDGRPEPVAVEEAVKRLRTRLFGEVSTLSRIPTKEEVERWTALARSLLDGVRAAGGPAGHDARVAEVSALLRPDIEAKDLDAIRSRVGGLLEEQNDFRRTLIAEKNELLSIVTFMAERLAMMATRSSSFGGRLGEFAKSVEAAASLDDLRKAKDRIVAETAKVQAETAETGERFSAVEQELQRARVRVKALEEELESKVREAITDRLTAAYNRRAFDERVSEMGRRRSRYGVPFSLLIFDVDHFKRFNDTYGHQAGDLVLIKVVKKAKECLRDLDFLARYGGEEFAVLLDGTHVEGATQVAEKIRRSLAERDYIFRHETVKITVSVGVAEWEDRDTPKTLIEKADRALYLSKKGGRNRVTSAMDLAESDLGAIYGKPEEPDVSVADFRTGPIEPPQ